MKRCWLFLLALLCGTMSPGVPDRREGAILIVVDAPLEPPAARALADLERALHARNCRTERRDALPSEGPAIVVGTPDSAAVGRLLAAHRIDLPEAPES